MMNDTPDPKGDHAPDPMKSDLGRPEPSHVNAQEPIDVSSDAGEAVTPSDSRN